LWSTPKDQPDRQEIDGQDLLPLLGHPGGSSHDCGKDAPGETGRVAAGRVKGMLPKNTLGRAMLKKLKIYAGGDHPHEAQCPAFWRCNFGDGENIGSVNTMWRGI